MREERLAVLGAPVPGLGQNSSAVDEEGAYPGVKVRARLSERTRDRGRCISSQEEAGSEDQACLGDEGAESQAEP